MQRHQKMILSCELFSCNQSKTVDIHFHDTYYIIAQGHLYLLLAFIVWLLWFLFMLTKKLYSKGLTWAHVIISFLTVLFLLFLLNVGGDILNPTRRRHLDYSNLNTFDQYSRI